MDYSFLRFEDSLEQAKKIKNSPLSSIAISQNPIQLLPNEYYLQKTNVASGIVFNGDYEAYLVDCNDRVKADVTSKVAINEFIDNNGINQIDIELYKLGLDFYKQSLYLKLVHTTSNDVFYSNSFFLTNYEAHKTTRFDYRNGNAFFGIAYNKNNFFQSIRLITWFADLVDETEVGNYYQISKGNTISNRPLYKQKEKYKFDYLNNFVFERTNAMLLSDIVYIDGIRQTNKTTCKSGEFIGDTNYYKSEFEVYKDYNQTYLPYPFIYQPLNLIDKTPLGVYTLASLPTEITLTFNRNVTLLSGNVVIKDSLGSVVATFNETDVNIVDNVATIDITGIITLNDNYTIEVDSDLFTDSVDNNSFYTWDFSVISGQYDNTQYDNNEYLVN